MKYKENSRYTQELKYVKHYGNSNVRYVDFLDKDGNKLSWTTNDYCKSYQSLQKVGLYSFTVKYIYKDVINIGYLKVK